MAFGYYSDIAINHTKVGAGNSSNFPVALLVTLARLATVANGGHTQNASGYDIRPCTDATLATQRTYQLTAFNATTGFLEMVYKEPTLDASADNHVYLANGDAGISTDGSSTGVWDSNFVARYSFKDGTTLSLVDSTSNASNGTGSGTPAAAAGVVTGSGAMVLTSAGSKYDSIGNPPIAAIEGLATATISMWVKRTASNSVGYMASTTSTGWYGIQIYITGNNVVFVKVSIATITATNGAPADTSWHQYVSVARSTGNGMEILVDNVSKQTGADVGVIATAFGSPWLIGTRTGGLDFSDLSFDEYRISKVARSADWLTAEYNNIGDLANFLTVGAEQTVGGSGVVSEDYQWPPGAPDLARDIVTVFS